MMRLGRFALFVSALVFASSAALAQDVPPKIWAIPFGTPIDSLGVDFVQPACGTDRGPPSLALDSFADFARCTPEASGLREIWFRYDDTLEYLARALRDPVLTIRMAMTKVGDQPAILSFLVDDQGRIRGYRAFTDPGADPRTRFNNQVASATMRAVLGTTWKCTDLPAAAGEGPIEGTFVKQDCDLVGDGFTAHNETRFYLKPGQAVVDPATGKPMLNAFESSASITVTEAAPYPPDDPKLPLVPPPAAPAADDKVGQFLAGLSKDCPGCDLSGADLRRRDLTGADLSGAKLVATNLHRAILRQTNFKGADLERADLNVADLTQTDFTGANMVSTMLFGARGTQTIFAGATMRAVRAGSIEIRQGNFENANLTTSDFGQSRLNDASLKGADLTGAYFFQSSLIRADMSGVRGDKAAFNQAVLRDAILSNGSFVDADFQTANLLGADLSQSDFTHVRFEQANIRDTNRTGTTLTGSLMPDGTIAP